MKSPPIARDISRLSGRTLLTGIFGDPVEHSLSPAMHNAAYAALGLDRAYVPFHVRPAELVRAIRAVIALGILGVNITVPHKEHAARIVGGIGTLSAEARRLGAINCIVNRRGRLFGDNTDAGGLEIDLRSMRLKLVGRSAIVIGAGGGAAAAVLALSRMGARSIVIANRTPERARQLARRLKIRGVEVRPLDALAERSTLEDAAIAINATSVGLGGACFPAIDYGASPRNCLFYDLLYGRTPSEFLRRAARAGRRTADGAGMLLNQGVLAFRLFNRIAAPVRVMKSALYRELGRAG